MATDLTAECMQGYSADSDMPGAKCPFYFSSDSWLAYQAGQLMAAKGLSAPALCRMSRGFSVRIRTKGDTDFLFKAAGADLENMFLTRV